MARESVYRLSLGVITIFVGASMKIILAMCRIERSPLADYTLIENGELRR